MKKSELIQAYACAKTLWRSFNLPDNELEVKLHDEVWFEMLRPFDISLVLAAMRDYSKQSDFCNIGKIVVGCEQEINKHKWDYLYADLDDPALDFMFETEEETQARLTHTKQLKSSE